MPQLIVTAKRDGFRRAGQAWSTTPRTIDTAEFSAEQLSALQAEPLLVVVGDTASTVATQSPADAIAAMLAEDPERKNEAWWLKDGRPEVRELERRTGANMKAAERDAAWTAHLEAAGDAQ